MKQLANVISAHRILSTIAFAIAYPLCIAIVMSMLPRVYPHAAFLLSRIADVSNALSALLQIAIHFLPVIIAFCFLPIKPRKRLVVTVILMAAIYLLVAIPLTFVFEHSITCQNNPQCF